MEFGVGVVLAFIEIDFLEQFAGDVLGVLFGGSVNQELAQVGFNSIGVHVQGFIASVLSPEINGDSDGSGLGKGSDACLGEFHFGESSAQFNFGVVSVGLASDGRSQ